LQREVREHWLTVVTRRPTRRLRHKDTTVECYELAASRGSRIARLETRIKESATCASMRSYLKAMTVPESGVLGQLFMRGESKWLIKHLAAVWHEGVVCCDGHDVSFVPCNGHRSLVSSTEFRV